jgi:hypothetical protein
MRNFEADIMKRVFTALWIILYLAGCSSSASISPPNPCDWSDSTFKKELDVLYPIGDASSDIETARGNPHGNFLRAAVPASDGRVHAAIVHAELHHGAKVASVSTYMTTTGTGGIMSGGFYRDVLLFDAAGKLQWSYRFKLD